MHTQMAETVMARSHGLNCHASNCHGSPRKPLAAWVTVLIHANVEQKAPRRRSHHATIDRRDRSAMVLESNLMNRIIPLAGLLLVAHALASCSDSRPGAAAAP